MFSKGIELSGRFIFYINTFKINTSVITTIIRWRCCIEEFLGICFNDFIEQYSSCGNAPMMGSVCVAMLLPENSTSMENYLK